MEIDIKQTPTTKIDDDLAFDITLKTVPYECMLLLEQMSWFYTDGRYLLNRNAEKLEEDKKEFLELLQTTILKTERELSRNKKLD